MNIKKLIFLIIFLLLNFSCISLIKEKYNKILKYIKINPKKSIFIGLTIVSQLENLTFNYSICNSSKDGKKKINYKNEEHSKLKCKALNALYKFPFFFGFIYNFCVFDKTQKYYNFNYHNLISFIPFFGNYYLIYKKKKN